MTGPPGRSVYVLADADDDDALWLTAALQRRGQPVEFVLPEELVRGSRLTCWITTDGAVSALELRDGRTIGVRTPALVVNRLTGVPTPGAGGTRDAAYLGEEWRAALATWLRTLQCAVLNPPRAASLVGPVLPPPAWRAMALRLGLPGRPWTHPRPPAPPSEVLDLVCVGSRCLGPDGPAPVELAGPMAALSRFVNAPLLGVSVCREGGRWLLDDATPLPRLAVHGSPLVEAILSCADAGGAAA
jgi:hypothetical protein